MGIGDKSALPTALIAVALSFAPLEQSQAQLFIHVYPSQDNPTSETLWIFSGDSTASANNSIRTSSGSSNFDNQDTWDFATSNNSGNIYNANKPGGNGENISLSPLFSSSNNPKDTASVRARIPGGGRTDITFAANATNTPTITIGSRTIANLLLNDGPGGDEVGIRVSGSGNFSYSYGQSSAWVGAGLINKPIGDFHAGNFNRARSFVTFAAGNTGSIRVVVNSQIIPEPEEYALIFGLFALGFVFVRR